MIVTPTWTFPVVPPDSPLNAPEGSGSVGLNGPAVPDWRDKDLVHQCLDEARPPEAAASHPPSSASSATASNAAERVEPAMPAPDSERAPLLRASRFGHRVTPLK